MNTICKRTHPKQSRSGCVNDANEWEWESVSWIYCKACKLYFSDRLIPSEYWNRDWRSEPKKNTAGVIIVKEGVSRNGFKCDKFWMIQSYHNSYGFPKGKVENGETMRQAAEREFYEETGTKVSLDKCMEIRQSLFSKGGEKIISFFVKKVPRDFVITTYPNSDHEITSFGWVDERDIRYFKLNKMSQDIINLIYK